MFYRFKNFAEKYFDKFILPQLAPPPPIKTWLRPWSVIVYCCYAHRTHGRTIKYEVTCTLVKVQVRPWALPWNFHGPRRLYKLAP